MARIKYMVDVQDSETKETVKMFEKEKRVDAINLAQKEAVEKNKSVFISFFRKSDGQTVYVNPYGAGITGERW